MTIIHAEIISLLKTNTGIAALVGARIWLASAPQENRAYPFVIVRCISQVRELTHSGSTGIVEGRFQIDCFGKNMSSALDVAEAIKNFFHGYRGIGASNHIHYSKLENEIDLVDEDIGFQVALDFLVTYYD